MKMKQVYQFTDADIDGTCAYYLCVCGLRSRTVAGVSFRGAAIKAGRAMRRIVEAVEARIARADNAAFAHGLRVGERDMARRAMRLLQNHKLTRSQITERMRQEAAL
jgi:CubicO group peptidase (beta-lactamase class C family)